MEKHRDYSQPLTWTGDLNDDCTARWAGLTLRAEWMDEDYWWWAVYDLFDEEAQIDSSNNYEKQTIGGEDARENAEKVARFHLKTELVQRLKHTDKALDFNQLITDLKHIGYSSDLTISILIGDFGLAFTDAKNRVANAYG